MDSKKKKKNKAEQVEADKKNKAKIIKVTEEMEGKKPNTDGEEVKEGTTSAAVLMKAKNGDDDVKLEQFKIVKVLDKGSFGKVCLVQCQKT